MTWHLDLCQHLNQIGFAITAAFVDPSELVGTAMADAFTCGECGVNAPAVHLELTVLFWTAMLIGHAEEQQQ
jgi:hypothetical protein